MTKQDFISKVSKIKNPFLREGTGSFNNGLLDYYLVVDSKTEFEKKFCTESVALTGKEYRSGKLDKYYQRESCLKQRYIRWFSEAVNHNNPDIRI